MPIDCIKIDVEGAEVLILDGMSEMLEQKAVATIITEFCPKIMLNSGLKPIQLYNRISPGFSISVVESEFRQVVGDGSIQDAEQFLKLENSLLNSGSFVRPARTA